jgi:hypothetical protein
LPLAVLGPLAIGLARLAAQGRRGAVAIILSDRTALLAGFAVAHLAALLPEALALFCLVVLAALLLRSAPD